MLVKVGNLDSKSHLPVYCPDLAALETLCQGIQWDEHQRNDWVKGEILCDEISIIVGCSEVRPPERSGIAGAASKADLPSVSPDRRTQLRHLRCRSGSTSSPCGLSSMRRASSASASAATSTAPSSVPSRVRSPACASPTWRRSSKRWAATRLRLATRPAEVIRGRCARLSRTSPSESASSASPARCGSPHLAPSVWRVADRPSRPQFHDTFGTGLSNVLTALSVSPRPSVQSVVAQRGHVA